MPINTEALKDSLNGRKPKIKRPIPNREQQQQQLDAVNAHARTTISALTQTGIDRINDQVSNLDRSLTRYERDTARAMADRLRQSPLRIQQYLMQELQAEPQEALNFSVLIDDALEVPDLTTDFLAIAPISAAGALPM